MTTKAAKTTTTKTQDTAAAATPVDENKIVSALDALGIALADQHHTWTQEQRALYEKAVQLAQKQATALERIANFEFGSDEPRGPAHAAIDQMRKIANDARGA